MERFISNQLVVDSGKDASGRPILAVYCCHLPDPETTNYDELLELSLKRLNRVVAEEYIMVIFTSPMEYSPPFSWMINAYKSLSRNYKKNIKQMIVVHPSWWFKFIIGFMQHIVSSKFAKKIINVDNLEDLETYVNTDDMMIPGDIREFDKEENGEQYDQAELEKAKEVMASKALPPVFAVPLSKSSPEGEYPEEIKLLMEYLTNKCLRTESIFRKSPNALHVKEIRSAMNKHEPVNFDTYDPHTLASVLKTFIRELPDPLIPRSTYENLTNIDTVPDDQLAAFVAKNFVKPLPNQERKLLKDVILLAAMTAQLSSVNRMSVRSLAVVWAPTMTRFESVQEDFAMSAQTQRLLYCMINEYDQVFCTGGTMW